MFFVWGQFTTDGLPLALWLYSSEQYFVHQFSISHSSVRHYTKQSWIVVAFLCFTVIKSFISWYALLLLFFLRFFVQSHYTILLSRFLLPFSCTAWCCYHYFPCISQIFQVWLFTLSVLSFCLTNQEFLRWPRLFSSDGVCQVSHWLFQSLLCWRWWSSNPCLHLHCSWMWEVLTSRLS